MLPQEGHQVHVEIHDPEPGLQERSPSLVSFSSMDSFHASEKTRKEKERQFSQGFPQQFIENIPPSGTSFYSHIFPLRYSFIFYLIPI